MTKPDTELQARLSSLENSDPIGMFFIDALVDAYRSGQLITRAEAEAMVGAEWEACATAYGWEAFVSDDAPAYLSEWQRGLVAGHRAQYLAIRARGEKS